jgi:hypothetical protein
MRNSIILLFVGLSMINISCHKDDDNVISYPNTISYGTNILTLPDSTVLSGQSDYDLGAVLGKDASLSLVITNLSAIDNVSGHLPVWFYDNISGWTVEDYNGMNNTQKFISSQTGTIDLNLTFETFGKRGKCRIDFYENATTITRTKYLKWE